MTRLLDRIAFVSGAASGIGLATAKRFDQEGAFLVLADRAADRLREVASELNGSGDRHLAITMDVTQEADWISAAQAIENRFGRLDILFNNAGYGVFQSIASTSLETWRAVMAVNLDSVFMATKYLLPLLERSGSGAIVNMSSIRGIVAGANASSYSTAKAAVRLFTKCTAIECAQIGNGVRANSIHPGHVETPLTAKAYSDPVLAKEFLAHTPIGRFAKPGDIADAILFLASDESRYMTGAELVVDGGVTAQ